MAVSNRKPSALYCTLNSVQIAATTEGQAGHKGRKTNRRGEQDNIGVL